MGYFYNRFSDSLYHSANKKHAEYGTKNSTSSEKGTDNKKNNTSEYNHEYYEGNKDKWKDNKSSNSTTKSNAKSDNDDLYYDKDGKARFGHKDYDANDADFKRTDGTKIEGTNLRQFVNANGSTIIMGDGIKFSFPPGTKISPQMAKKIAEIEKGDKSNKEQYIARMLNAVTGFADRQGLFGGNKKKSSGSSSKKESEAKSESKSPSKSTSEWDRRMSNYNGKADASKAAQEAAKAATERGKTRTQKEKKKSKQNAQFKHSNDLGSIFVKDLF